MSLGIHLLLTLTVFVIYGTAALLAIRSSRHSQADETSVLCPSDRLQLEAAVCEQLAHRLTADHNSQPQLCESWRSFPALLEKLNQAETAERHLRRLLPASAGRVDDEGLLAAARGLELRAEDLPMSVGIATKAQLESTNNDAARRTGARRTGVCIGLGIVICLGMLAFPPWSSCSEHWVKLLAAPNQEILVESRSAGFHWLLSRKMAEVEIQTIAPEDLSRLESTRQLHRVNYPRLAIQLALVLLSFAPFIFRRTNRPMRPPSPPAPRFERSMTAAQSCPG